MNIFKKKEYMSEIMSSIKEIGNIGAESAISGDKITANMAIDRLNQIRRKGEEVNNHNAVRESDEQINRILGWMK